MNLLVNYVNMNMNQRMLPYYGSYEIRYPRMHLMGQTTSAFNPVPLAPKGLALFSLLHHVLKDKCGDILYFSYSQQIQ